MTHTWPAQGLVIALLAFVPAAAAGDTIDDELCQRIFAAIDEPAITFGLQGHELRPSAHAALDRIINFARNCPDGTIVIVGHSDSIGDERFNIHISRQRAQSVADYLLRGGVPANRIAVESRGSSEPIANNDTRTGRAKNRRIELKLVLPADSD
ncbi:MAG: OmpA family protein [Woeseiaceae bacterium]|nr:OmpA family protein [Woeseiaceae bacterium]